MSVPALAFCGVVLTSRIRPKSIENPKNIGQQIKKRRMELKLFQSDVAKIIGVSEDTITYWETGRSEPQIQFYTKIIQFLGYNPFLVNSETLGGRIKNYRIENGLNQRQLAKMLGVNETTIRSWELNLHTPFSKKMKLLGELINQKELSK